MLTFSENDSSYRFLSDVAMKAMRADGWTITKAPGHGRANVWNISKKGKDGRVSIRTTQNRWIAYQPQDGGKHWKTLDAVDFVCVSAFSYDESSDSPTGVDVHLIEANVIRDVFNQNHSARISEDHTVTDNFGMWVCIDKCEGTQAAHTGSGFATAKNLIASYQLDGSDDAPETDGHADRPAPLRPSVSDILENARTEISRITGIPVEGISLDLHMKA